jgi:GH25 family lysozyme M1 (1,4-beta-N-acetylmuramidase)
MPVASRLRVRRRLRAGAVVAWVVLMAAALVTAPARAAAAGVQEGIDVSEFQGSINWGQVAGAGKSFAYIRAGEGSSYHDPKFQTNWSGAAGGGLSKGAYLYFHPSNDSVAQANLLVQQLQSVNFGQGDLVPAIDVETTDGLSASTLVTNLHTVVNSVRSAIGALPAIYASPAFWHDSVGDSPEFGADPLWIAHWFVSSPTVPANNWSGNGYAAWQYADNGSVSGISGSVDLDRGNPGPPLYSVAAQPTKSPAEAQLTYWQTASGHLDEAWCCGPDSTNGWHNPIDLTGLWGGGSPLASTPAIAVAPDGTQHVYWRGNGGHLYAAQCCPPGAVAGWPQPVDLTAGWGGAAPLISAPATTLSSGGTQYLYWEGSAGHLYTASAAGSSWNSPVDLTNLWGAAAPLASAPSATLRPDGSQLVYWEGSSGHLYTATCCDSSYPSGWHPPIDLTALFGGAAPPASAPSAVLTSDGSQQVYWQGPSGHLYMATCCHPIQCSAPSPGSRGCMVSGNPSGWRPPLDITNLLGGAAPLTSAPAAALKSDGTQLVYWQGPGGHLFQTLCCDNPANSGWRIPLDMTGMWAGLAPPASAPAAAFSPDGILMSLNPLTQGSSGLSVSAAVEPATGHLDVAALGPSNSLYFFWQISGTWNGPVQLGQLGAAQSAPSIVVDPNGHADVAVQGPANSIYFYWQTNSGWNGPLQAASPGSAYSSPSLGVDTNGKLFLAAKGAGNSLNYWSAVGGNWSGPTQVAGSGTTNFAPSVVIPSTTTFLIGAVTDNHQAVVYSNTNGSWNPPRYSAPSLAYSTGTGSALDWMGPGNSLVVNTAQTNSDYVITPAGATCSSPALVGTTGADYAAVMAGPSNSLNYSWTSSRAVGGPVQIGGANTTYSAPSILREPGNNLDVAVEGPNNTLYVYWESGGTWHGPFAVGPSGTTYSSAS